MLIAAATRKRFIKSGMTNVKIRITHKGESRYLATKYYVLPDQFADGQVVNHQSSIFINLQLKKIILDYEEKLIKVNIKTLPISRIVELLTSKEEPNDFIAYYNKFIDEKESINHRTAEIYTESLAKIQKFDKRIPLLFEDINPGWLFRFETWMNKTGVKSANSRAIIFRNIRAVINSAINNDIIPQNLYPFRRFRIKEEDTLQKGLTIDEIKAIRGYQTRWPVEALARDTFMLSFYLIGINNNDLYNIEAITGNGRITYFRAKTGRKYSIKLEPEARELIERLKGTKHLLIYPEIYDNVHAMTHSVNKALKKIQDELTMYHARHTWGTIARKECKASIDDIGTALGHTKKGGKKTTWGYIKEDENVSDKLNRQVLDCLKEKKEDLPKDSIK